MKYIGPFLKMNKLSNEDICGQLFHLSKEAVKTISLNSKCGITFSFRSSKKSHTHNDINISKDFSPLICIYKKASPLFLHNKTNYGFDDTSFKKEILPKTNALMTLCILELYDYYDNYKSNSKSILSIQNVYKILCEKQLNFYSQNLRNSDGMFIERKNSTTNTLKRYSLSDHYKKVTLEDQAFMMAAYYAFYYYFPTNELANDYKNFSNEILNMLIQSKDDLYNTSFEEIEMILLAIILAYKYSNNDNCKELIIDLCDFLISKYDDNPSLQEKIDLTSLFYLLLIESYKYTNMLAFKEKSTEIIEYLEGLYDSSKGIYIKNSNKKEIKYNSDELCLYFLALFTENYDKSELKMNNIISSLYKNIFINSGIISSWPSAPTLDEVERYKFLSLNSKDMLEESYFRMPSFSTPESIGIAPIFFKKATYSKRKNIFSASKSSFDSSKNVFIFFNFIYHLKSKVINTIF